MKHLLTTLLFLFPLALEAQNWDVVRQSDEYYYGEGQGKTEAEAKRNAQEALTASIATHVSSDFESLDVSSTGGGEAKHRAMVQSCLKTYAQATLTNLRFLPSAETKSGFVVRCFMKRSELSRIYESRIARSKTMARQAGNFLEKRKLGEALKYYYWAYSLIRSLQFPSEVTNDKGEILLDVIPAIIEDILTDIEVKYAGQADDMVKLKFTYQKEPIRTLDFLYNDGGTNDATGEVKDGNGILSMHPGHNDDRIYHLRVDYECKNRAQGDNEVMSVLNVITPKVFAGTAHAVENGDRGIVKDDPGIKAESYDYKLETNQTQVVPDNDEYAYATIMTKVAEAARTGNFANVERYFTPKGGLPRYRELLKRGRARIVGNPEFKFFKGRDGQVVARGLQLALTYVSSGKKQTFVEDVVFTFDGDKRIDNVTFGLGQMATNDILCKNTGWSDEAKEMLTEFLENYKTAYCMKDIDYIRQIFADDAVIIVGNVVRKAPTNNNWREQNISIEGQGIINENKYTKEQYLANLKRCFDRQEFVNVRFAQNDIQYLEKLKERDNKEVYGIRIAQEYASTTYSDSGYLFLMVDLTDRDVPQIKIRTWQPQITKWEDLYAAGDFYDF